MRLRGKQPTQSIGAGDTNTGTRREEARYCGTRISAPRISTVSGIAITSTGTVKGCQFLARRHEHRHFNQEDTTTLEVTDDIRTTERGRGAGGVSFKLSDRII